MECHAPGDHAFSTLDSAYFEKHRGGVEQGAEKEKERVSPARRRQPGSKATHRLPVVPAPGLQAVPCNMVYKNLRIRHKIGDKNFRRLLFILSIGNETCHSSIKESPLLINGAVGKKKQNSIQSTPLQKGKKMFP